MSSYYQIKDVEGRGLAVFAEQNLLPGKIFLCDEPLIFIDGNDFQPYSAWSDKNYARIFCMWSKFLLEPVETQIKILGLYGPLHGEAEQLYAEEIKESFSKYCDHEGVQSSEKNELFEKFLSFTSVFKYNAFGGDDQNDEADVDVSESFIIAIYDNASRFAHSCLPNTLRTFEGKKIVIRVILPVKQGEELTLEYNPFYRTKPTHFRRHRYLLTKEFTCHCPRCDALGDDTRQFNCCNMRCKGMHLVCQPINQEPFSMVVGGASTPAVSDLKYSDVEYVEPYLLPCTVCSRVAPVEYQSEMFALEARIPAITEQLSAEYIGNLTNWNLNFSQWKVFVERVKATRLPVKHGVSRELLLLAFKLACKAINFDNHMYSNGTQQDEAFRSIEKISHDYITNCEVVGSIFSSEEISQSYFMVGCIWAAFDALDSIDYMKRGLRASAIIYGRDSVKNKKFDTQLVAVMDHVMSGRAMVKSHSYTMQVGGISDPRECLFCGQKAGESVFSLRQCSKCKNAEYCSRECQTLHWKFHKIMCGKI